MTKNARDELLNELMGRFKQEGRFKKSEEVNRRKRDAIFIDHKALAEDGVYVVDPNNQNLHPDFEVLLDKYDAWIDYTSQGIFVYITMKIERKRDFNRPFKKAFSLKGI